MYQEHSVLATVTLKQSKLHPEELSMHVNGHSPTQYRMYGWKKDHGLWVPAAYVHQLNSCINISLGRNGNHKTTNNRERNIVQKQAPNQPASARRGLSHCQFEAGCTSLCTMRRRRR